MSSNKKDPNEYEWLQNAIKDTADEVKKCNDLEASKNYVELGNSRLGFYSVDQRNAVNGEVSNLQKTIEIADHRYSKDPEMRYEVIKGVIDDRCKKITEVNSNEATGKDVSKEPYGSLSVKERLAVKSELDGLSQEFTKQRELAKGFNLDPQS